MKIASWNINGINRRLPLLLQWLAEAAPDVVCLQELKAADAKFPRGALEDAGYGAIWQGEPAFNGVAILARDAVPIQTQRGLPGDAGDRQARYLEAAVDGVLIGCLYLPNGNPQPGPKFDYKLAWFERLCAHALSRAALSAPVVLAGDYNVVPTDGVEDIYNPKSWRDNALLQPAARAAWSRLRAQGWTDALAARPADTPHYTFWDYQRQRWARNAGLRIDHFLLNDAAAHRLGAAGVDRAPRGWPEASDHAPIWLELQGAAAARTPARRDAR